MQILVIEDSPMSVRALELKLGADGHNLAAVGSGEEGLEMATLYDYDVILLDIGLPDMSGLEVVRQLRLDKIETPVIVVSGAGEVDMKVKALSAGADDYLIKPFNNAELAARINAVVRRAHGHAQSVIQAGEISLNLDSRRASVAGREIHLTPSEYKILELLALRKNTVLSKEACLNHLYNGMSDPEVKIIDVFVCKLRKKIAEVTDAGVIETVWGNGYMLRDGAEARSAA
jgi:two-component system cell cycle response regulator CtrA